MTDRKNELHDTQSRLRKEADSLDELNLGTFAETLRMLASRIPVVDKEEELWRKVERGAWNYILRHGYQLPDPEVSISYGEALERQVDQLTITFRVDLEDDAGRKIRDLEKWVEIFDPGDPLTRCCPTCHVDPGVPCSAPRPKGLYVHSARRRR